MNPVSSRIVWNRIIVTFKTQKHVSTTKNLNRLRETHRLQYKCRIGKCNNVIFAISTQIAVVEIVHSN